MLQGSLSAFSYKLSRGASIILLVYDITNRETFNRLHSYLEKGQDNLSPILSKNVGVLLGNKVDLNQHRQVKREEGEKFAEEHQFLFFETSAEIGIGVEEAINKSMKNCFDKINFHISSRFDDEDRNVQLPLWMCGIIALVSLLVLLVFYFKN